MIKINLLPYREERRKVELRRQAVIFSVFFALFIIMVVSVHGYLLLSTRSLEKKVVQAESEFKKLQVITGDVEKFKKDKALVEKKLAIIESLEKNRAFPGLLLDTLAENITAGKMWLISIVERSQSLRIEGIALDNQTIALFMTEIEKSRYIDSVDLLSSQQTTVSGVKLMKFSLSCVLRRG